MPSILRALLTNNARKYGESFFAPLSTRHVSFKTNKFDDTQAGTSSSTLITGIQGTAVRRESTPAPPSSRPCV